MNERGVWTHKGHEITVNGMGEFCIAEGSSHATLALAEAAVDRMMSSRKARKVSNMGLAVVTQAGVHAHVKAIHGGTGGILFQESDVEVRRTGWGSGVYPDVPWLAATLEEIIRLDKMHRDLHERIKGYQLRELSHGQQRDVGHSEQLLREDYEGRLKHAQDSPEAEAWDELDWRPGDVKP